MTVRELLSYLQEATKTGEIKGEFPVVLITGPGESFDVKQAYPPYANDRLILSALPPGEMLAILQSKVDKILDKMPARPDDEDEDEE